MNGMNKLPHSSHLLAICDSSESHGIRGVRPV
jgi:hypothetical protein